MRCLGREISQEASQRDLTNIRSHRLPPVIVHSSETRPRPLKIYPTRAGTRCPYAYLACSFLSSGVLLHNTACHRLSLTGLWAGEEEVVAMKSSSSGIPAWKFHGINDELSSSSFSQYQPKFPICVFSSIFQERCGLSCLISCDVTRRPS
ncbi:uncharacterized protein BCR38DRAFT_63396 [Pseudomassariella vexata]|uniref:Uncharacterized protein n=1 Tax=Pseudomassariella vexata TaxID=1141098 RepID=A0A1Y2DIK2_9PEZI|nr:uncharacterized protein BCR38DRAFT_63396 [Pseudomassariella vexata]ORY59060.1 hypothetical protein BCR38DRAFT_63396 [Pseudomassariella vexata]